MKDLLTVNRAVQKLIIHNQIKNYYYYYYYNNGHSTNGML